jgi:predicted nucleic-acid-binding Zn-ribbon protein
MSTNCASLLIDLFSAQMPEVEFDGTHPYWPWVQITNTDFPPLLDMQKRTYCNKICNYARYSVYLKHPFNEGENTLTDAFWFIFYKIRREKKKHKCTNRSLFSSTVVLTIKHSHHLKHVLLMIPFQLFFISMLIFLALFIFRICKEKVLLWLERCIFWKKIL